MSEREKGSSREPWVLGVSASHNGSACLLHGSRIVCAIQEERLTRGKRDRIDGARPSLAVAYCLQAAGIEIKDLSLIVICTQEPSTDPAQDVLLNPQFDLVRSGVPIRRISHHLGHAYCAYALSGERSAAVLVVDGAGSPHSDLEVAEQQATRTKPGWEATSLYFANDEVLTALEKHSSGGREWLEPRGSGMPAFSSLGGMYSAAAVQIFGDPLEAGKVMGLAPMGAPTLAPEEFLVFEQGLPLFRDSVPDRFLEQRHWPARRQEYANLAASVQKALEVALLELCRRIRLQTGSDALCFAGGVALNGIANERIAQEAGFSRFYVPAAAEDSGTAIGAAYHGLWQLTGFQPIAPVLSDSMGRSYCQAEVDDAVASVPFVRSIASGSAVREQVVERLLAGQFGGWFESGSELGPRALGQRSIICDPRNPGAKDELNLRIKRREDFRPFAPAILAEAVPEWFAGVTDPDNPFMLRIWSFREDRRAAVPAVVHVDGSGRAQTVHADRSPGFYQLIQKFADRTGVPILLNTSFNGKGEPIVETPEDALWCMVENGLDFLVLEGQLLTSEGSLEDILNLTPSLAVGQTELSAGLVRARALAAKLNCQVTTPWGKLEQRVGSMWFPVLENIDGKADGHKLLEKLGGEGEGWTPVSLARTLAALRSKRIVRFSAIERVT